MVLIINYILCIRIYKSSIGFEYSLSTFIVDPDLVRKVKYISLVEGILLKDVISEALNNYVDAWEEKNKKIRLPKAK